MNEHEAHRAAIRRVSIRAALVVIALIAIGFGVSKAISALRRDRGEGLGLLHADKPADRPATKGEVKSSRNAEERLSRTQHEIWKDATTIAPSEPKKDTSGERLRWFEGFGVSVESKPTGATVLVDGRDVGRTPVVATVPCDPGDEVHVEVRKPPRRPQQRNTTCREDKLVELVFELK